MNLFSELKRVLPFYVYPTKRLVKEMPDLKLSRNSALKVSDVHYMGEMGGISCAVDVTGKIMVASITHLNFLNEHPLKTAIDEYKKDRIAMLRAEHSFNSADSVSRNALCPCGSGKKYKRCCL